MEIQPYDDEFDPLGSSSFFCDKGASCSRPSALAAGRREDHAPENGSVFIGDVCGMPFTAEDVAEQQRLMNACAARHKTVDVEAEVFGERLAEQGKVAASWLSRACRSLSGSLRAGADLLRVDAATAHAEVLKKALPPPCLPHTAVKPPKRATPPSPASPASSVRSLGAASMAPSTPGCIEDAVAAARAQGTLQARARCQSLPGAQPQRTSASASAPVNAISVMRRALSVSREDVLEATMASRMQRSASHHGQCLPDLPRELQMV